MQLGESLPEFNLPGTDNQGHSTQDYEDKKAVAIIFTCNHCPYARAYIDRISELVDEFEDKGVGFYAISANDAKRYPQDSFDNMIPMGKALHLDGKYLYDEPQEVTATFGAERTPEVFLFDENRKLVYHGAIDDNYENPNAVSQHYFRDALNTVLEGNSPVTQETQAVGCTIKWKQS